VVPSPRQGGDGFSERGEVDGGVVCFHRQERLNTRSPVGLWRPRPAAARASSGLGGWRGWDQTPGRREPWRGWDLSLAVLTRWDGLRGRRADPTQWREYYVKGSRES
jgi:hypothetical protein